MSSLKTETLNGAKWLLLQKVMLDPLLLLSSMVLARYISPAEMGILGLTTIFFAVAEQLASAGFGSALIRKIDRTEEDINTMFWFNAFMSLLMSGALCAAAPWFASFFGQPALLKLTCVSAGMMFLNSFGAVHWTLYTCRRDFKTPAVIQSSASIASLPVGIILAVCGWSYWAIVMQGTCSGLLRLAIVWRVSPWKPRLLFSWNSFRNLFSFGSKLAASGLLFVLYSNLRTFIIGKFYSPADLGLYNRGDRLSSMVPQTVGGMLDAVSYPILATVQNDDERLLSAYRKYICISTLLLAWGSIVLCALADPLVGVMYGEKWLSCAPYAQIISLSLCLNHISVINLNLLKVKGRSDLFLRLEIIKRAISVALILYAASVSIMAICWSLVIYSQIAIFINCYYTGKIISLTWWQQQKDYFPYVIAAAMSALPAWGVTCLPFEKWVEPNGGEAVSLAAHYGLLIGQIVVGGLISAMLYFGYLHLRRDAALVELLVCVREHKTASRIPLLGRWARSLTAAAGR